MNSYEHLFSPIQIGTTTVKNRVFMPPISTNLADKGYVTDELVEHYAARPKRWSWSDHYGSHYRRAYLYLSAGRYVYLRRFLHSGLEETDRRSS